MPKRPDRLHFEYELTGTGWSVGALALGDSSASLSASYLSDALGDLLAAVWMVTEGEREVRCSWDEEPGEYRWLFETESGAVHLRVLWFDELWGGAPDDEGRLVFEADTTRRDLVDAMCQAAQAVWDEYGAAGYREKWVDHDFPLDLLRQLQSWGDSQELS